MPDQSDVRRLALAQPEATEEPHHERTSFRVRGKIFATFQPGSDAANLALPPELALEVVDRESGVSPINWGSIKGWVRLDLADVREGLLEQLIPAAWSRVAPKRLQQARTVA